MLHRPRLGYVLRGAWANQAERVATTATDPPNLIWVMPAEGRA